MKTQLIELITKISSGCMSAEEIDTIADEASQAFADPEAFLAANPDINYDDSFTIPLGEWVVVGSLPETVLFHADDYPDLLQQIIDSFGPEVTFNIQPKQLKKVDPLRAMHRIQVQLSALYPEKGGYVLVGFSDPMEDDILQAVLVYKQDVARVLELADELQIDAVEVYESMKGAQDDD
ncbi:hypothetical protein PSm6_34670 [Pseudomonas solani]|uniref:Uncharacterized protein n=1 Tax=Pseudomonas solani TaxID=2731552 RepID=A0AAU7Y5W0_9PSED|nr:MULTISPECIES: hypothetical protein [Pseudomonas]MBB4822286.1 hypothetical protein [Pseudomonas alcaligenes]MCU9947580.1 hypothetical protein [Pseudomonas sp. PDM13]BCD87060.1 hypothetical protein PSm6_34670 [Pseudomonas solani]